MLTRPSFTINDAVAELGGTFASHNMAASRHIDLGILKIANSNRRGRSFQAGQVLDVFDRYKASPSPLAVTGHRDLSVDPDR